MSAYHKVMTGAAENGAAEAIRAGDEGAFTALAEQHRGELEVHCYRMLGSLEDANDAVQDTFMRAWRYRASLKEGAPLRPWLYRIATNVCLDAIARDKRRVLATTSSETDAETDRRAAVGEVTWLQPYPDTRLEAVAPRDAEPDARLVTKENIELAFLTVIQLLTPEQRAALILRDVLGWSARASAELLEVSEAAVNGALQRARAKLRKHLPARRPEWPAGVDATRAERELLQKFVAATENADVGAFEALIREDAAFRMPPQPEIQVGRDAILRSWVEGGFGSAAFGQLRCVITRANLQPAVACYVVKEGDAVPRALAMDVLRIEEGLITDIVGFPADVFEAFGLPATLEPRGTEG